MTIYGYMYLMFKFESISKYSEKVGFNGNFSDYKVERACAFSLICIKLV